MLARLARRARRNAAAQFVSRRSPTSPTATSKCCADDDRALPTGWRSARYVPARTSSWPEASRLFVVGDDFGWSIDDDRARLTATAQAPRLRRRARRLGALREAAGRLPPRPLRRAAASLARLVAPARAQLLPRTAGNAGLSGVRPRLRGAAAPRGADRPGAGDARRDARARGRCRRRSGEGVPHPDRHRPRALSARDDDESRAAARAALAIPESAFVVGSFLKDGVGLGDGIEPKLVKGPDTLVGSARAAARARFRSSSSCSPARRAAMSARELESLGIPYRHVLLGSRDELGARLSRARRVRSSRRGRKAGRRRCSSRWRPASRSSRRASARRPSSSSTATTACSPTSTTSTRWRLRSSRVHDDAALARTLRERGRPTAEANAEERLDPSLGRSCSTGSCEECRWRLTARASAATLRAARRWARLLSPRRGRTAACVCSTATISCRQHGEPVAGRHGEVPAARRALPEQSRRLHAALPGLDVAAARPRRRSCASRERRGRPGRRSTRTESRIRAGRATRPMS